MLKTQHKIPPNKLFYKRRIIMDWILGVQRDKSLLAETAFTCFNIFDRVLCTMEIDDLEKFPLIGVTVLFLAAKYVEIYPPELDMLLDNCFAKFDRDYTISDFAEMESEILRHLDYELHFASPYLFLKRFMQVVDEKNEQYFATSEFLMEFCTFNFEFASLRSSLQAATCIYATSKILRFKAGEEFWRKFQHYSGYSENELKKSIKKVFDYLIAEKEESFKRSQIYKKYNGEFEEEEDPNVPRIYYPKVAPIVNRYVKALLNQLKE